MTLLRGVTPCNVGRWVPKKRETVTLAPRLQFAQSLNGPSTKQAMRSQRAFVVDIVPTSQLMATVGRVQRLRCVFPTGEIQFKCDVESK